MKKRVFLLSSVFVLLISIMVSCKKDQLATLVTDNVTDYYATVAILSGNISDEGSSEITAYGFVWNTTENPSLESNIGKIDLGSATGAFSHTINGLDPGTVYYVKAYATNEVGTTYGNQVSFETKGELCVGTTTVTDIDGNIYNVVQIGDQCWMAENLKTTKYNDNTAIHNITNGTEWKTTLDGAYTYYNHDIAQKDTLGSLYNYYAVETDKLCPNGWHVPTDNEWKTLEGTVDSQYGVGNTVWDNSDWRGQDAGEKLKSGEKWFYGGTGTDDYGFSAIAGGDIDGQSGEFERTGEWGTWWAAKNGDEAEIYRRYITNQNENIARYSSNPRSGYSIRCIKD